MAGNDKVDVLVLDIAHKLAQIGVDALTLLWVGPLTLVDVLADNRVGQLEDRTVHRPAVQKQRPTLEPVKVRRDVRLDDSLDTHGVVVVDVLEGLAEVANVYLVDTVRL